MSKRATASQVLAPRATALGFAVAVAFGALPASAQPRAKANADRAVTVTQTKNMCFSDTLQVTGVLVARDEVLVRPDREGLQVSQVLVEPGADVTLGQVLARLVPPEGVPGASVAVQAPAAGIVIASNAVIGATASARAEPLFRIAARGELELLAEAPVKSLASLAPGQSAKVEILGLGELSGKVRLASIAINPLTQLGQVRLFIGTDTRLRVGAFGRANIEIGERCSSAVPLSALLYGAGGTVVQVVRDGRIETRTVTVGLLEDGQAEIREGLVEGEMVVARAGAFVREGDRVRPITADEAPSRQ